MNKLLNGVATFQNKVFKDHKGLYERLSHEGQHPRILFITCSDSRVDPVLLTQSEPGELFVIRNAGNLVPPWSGNTCGEAASIEYAIDVLKVEQVVVCGHTQCGAICHLIDHHDHLYDEHLPMVSQWLRYADVARTVTEGHWNELADDERVNFAIKTNVKAQMKNLETHPSVARALSCGTLELYGWLFCMDTGIVQMYNPVNDTFEVLADDTPTPDTSVINLTPKPRQMDQSKTA